MNAIRTRKPTGTVPWPLILVEGGEKTGKSYTAAEFTADQRLGQAYWIDLGEGSADEYSAIEGANYLVVDHDGTWKDINSQVAAIRTEAQRANTAGEKPVVLIIDSMTAEWDMLKDWATARAVASKFGQRLLQKDPNAEIKPDNRLWNDANQRHAILMRMLMTFPGVVVMTARGKEVAAMGDDGKPVPGKKDYRVEGQKGLAFDASAWVRLSRDEAPKVIGVRSVHSGVRPGVDRPVPAPSFSLAWLVFDILKCDPKTAKVRDLRDLDSTAEVAPDEPAPAPETEQPRVEQPPIDWDALTETANNAEDVNVLRNMFKYIQNATGDQADTLRALITTRGKALSQKAQETEAAAAVAAVQEQIPNAEIITPELVTNGAPQ